MQPCFSAHEFFCNPSCEPCVCNRQGGCAPLTPVFLSRASLLQSSLCKTHHASILLAAGGGEGGCAPAFFSRASSLQSVCKDFSAPSTSPYVSRCAVHSTRACSRHLVAALSAGCQRVSPGAGNMAHCPNHGRDAQLGCRAQARIGELQEAARPSASQGSGSHVAAGPVGGVLTEAILPYSIISPALTPWKANERWVYWPPSRWHLHRIWCTARVTGALPLLTPDSNFLRLVPFCPFCRAQAAGIFHLTSHGRSQGALPECKRRQQSFR